MNREEALKLIPPGWVECDEDRWCQSDTGLRYDIEWLAEAIYAIPAPKPEPRRVPCGEMVVEFDDDGWPSFRGCWTGPTGESFKDTKWKIDLDTREWVEVTK